MRRAFGCDLRLNLLPVTDFAVGSRAAGGAARDQAEGPGPYNNYRTRQAPQPLLLIL